RWSVRDPHHVKCRFCETVFPNEDYPEDRILRVTNPVGKEVEYPYWADSKGYRYLFSAKAWYQAKRYFARVAHDLGRLYQATGDRQYARRAALILDAFARHYPGYLVSIDRPSRPKGFAPHPPYPNAGGKWGRWRHDEMPLYPAYAYDLIYDSGELEALSQETGVDVKHRIEEDFFRGSIRQVEHFPPNYSNAAPRIYQGYAAIGRVLGEPGYVHTAVQLSRGLFERFFFVDGFWKEGSPGYHRMTMGGMSRVFKALKGHTDPPGYVHPVDGTRLDDLDLERDIGIMGRASTILEFCRYPDGRTFPVHDNRASYRNARPLERSESRLLAGVGHAWLGWGEGDDQVQLHLHFSGSYGHAHADNLNLMLFAKGHELLSDVGYTHTRYRGWSKSSLCHNVVLIDEKEQNTRGRREPTDGRLLAFEASHRPVQWMTASGERGYPGLADLYRRTLMLVDAGDGDAYVVDLFDVTGGSRHDWVLHGSADRDGLASVDVPLEPYGKNLLPGVEVRMPAHESDRGDARGRNLGYAFFQNVSHGRAADGLSLQMAVLDSAGTSQLAGVRTHLPDLSGAEVYLGDAPSLRRARENDALLDEYRMPIFLARRKGSSPLSSRFVAVHEPYGDEGYIEEVSLVPVSGHPDAVVVKIRHKGMTDYVVIQGTTGSEKLAAEKLGMQGETAFVRERNGDPVAMGLWGGDELRWGGHVLTGSGTYGGTVKGVLREGDGDSCNALVVSGELPGGDVLNGATVIATFGDGSTIGYRVSDVKRVSRLRAGRYGGQAGETRLALRDDPGIAIDQKGMRHLFFPLREIPGRVTYHLRTSAFVAFEDDSGMVESVGEAGLSHGR
ncbi:MAG: heparinase II/III family protein, partial [Candidatus Latescibacteria bacterium]|nr:heparinase II/III family protein [Candidatus Latescibacterota bacterium]